jgi:hypothetical protein
VKRRKLIKIVTLIFIVILCKVSNSSYEYDEHQFGPATLKTEWWIDNKKVFKSPSSVDVEFVNAGAFDFVIADASGKEVKTVRAKNEHGGWTSIHFSSEGLYKDYSIGFRNQSDGELQLKQGVVYLR